MTSNTDKTRKCRLAKKIKAGHKNKKRIKKIGTTQELFYVGKKQLNSFFLSDNDGINTL